MTRIQSEKSSGWLGRLKRHPNPAPSLSDMGTTRSLQPTSKALSEGLGSAALTGALRLAVLLALLLGFFIGLDMIEMNPNQVDCSLVDCSFVQPFELSREIS